jgi:cysteinyl-tRNA synthetase
MFHQQDAMRLLAAMERFDAVLGVLADDDGNTLKKFGAIAVRTDMPPERVEMLIEERNAAKKRRDFKRADAIRQQLANSGIILEDRKDGTILWKHK